MENLLIGTIVKGKSQEIRVQVVEFRGKARLDVRLFVKVDGRFIPTRKGISLDLRMANALKELIDRACNKTMSV